jgi:hypothetical protein
VLPEFDDPNQQPELPLKLIRGWNTLPKAKVRRPLPDVPFGWAYTYTAFSLAFANAALELLGAVPGRSVLDPFVGSGTTVVAAAARRCKALGIDVSPFSSLLTKARLALSADPELVHYYLSKGLCELAPSEKSDVLGPENSSFAYSVVTAMSIARGLKPDRLWIELLADDAGIHDSEVVALMSLAIGARDCAKVVRGSNPIWLRKLAERPTASLKQASMEWATIICNDLRNSPPLTRYGCCVVNTDINCTVVRSEFDICLTSPPYPNRLDYVVAHLPELSVLQLIAPTSIRDLRASMIGTTTIVTKNTDEIRLAWGPSCVKTLEAILAHDSYASRRYYYHTYYLYFDRLYKALGRTVEALRRGAQGAIVLQDSFYKDVNIPIPKICVEMLQSHSCSAEIVRTAPVRTHMGQMSPLQHSYVPRKIFGESIVHFARH